MTMLRTQDPLMVGTVTGKLIDVANFKAEDIDITDIAASLSQQRRYAGHTELPWTVGQHLIFGTMLAEQGGADPLHIKAVFLHDVEETWVQDIIYPIKRSFKSDSYKELCKDVSSVVYDHFGCHGYSKDYVSLIDQICYMYEHYALRPRASYELGMADEVVERFEWYKDTLKLGIPEELINMSDEQVAQIIAETLTVMVAEKTIGAEISSEIQVDDIENAIKKELIL